MAVFPTVYVESMRSPHGVQRDFPKYSGLHGKSSMDSVETPRGFSVDLLWIYRFLSTFPPFYHFSYHFITYSFP